MSLDSPELPDANLTLGALVLYASDMETSRRFYEQALGFRTILAGPDLAVYALGDARLCILPASAHGVTLAEGKDRSADITLMVGDFTRCHAVLESRGVRFSRTLEYVVGKTADFYDPDGHWFSLYQASEAAKTWPSGEKLLALESARSMHETSSPEASEDLSDALLAYIFLFFSQAESAENFYARVLGLEAIEGGPCRRIATTAERGVVKYDVGPTMLTTHHVDVDDKRFRVSTVGSNGVAMAFRVVDLAASVASLSRREIAISDKLEESSMGRVARFADPAGHVLLLWEPTQEISSGWNMYAGMSLHTASKG